LSLEFSKIITIYW